VVQPAWHKQSSSFSVPGPTLQFEMFRANKPPDAQGVEEFCEKARQWFARSSLIATAP